MLNMGMRSVPTGDQDCFSFDIYKNTWKRLPDIPIGKLHPALVVINSRYIFQIGGFDDFDIAIYRLDMRHQDRQWKTLLLDKTQPIIDNEFYTP